MANKSPTERLLDSALLIGIVTGLCYVLGFLAQMRAGWAYDIPWHLLPSPPLHQTLVVGGIYLLIYIAVGLLLYLFYVWLEKRIKRLGAVRGYFQERFAEHKVAFSLFLGLIACTVLFLVPLYLQSPVGRHILHGKNLPKVIEMQAKHHKPVTSQDGWSYVSRKDGVIILSRLNDRLYMLVREDDLEKLIIEIPK